MTRRKLMLLAGSFLLVAIGAGVYVPEYFSPLPGLVDEMRSCLHVVADEPAPPAAPASLKNQVNVSLFIYGLNVSRCRKTLLAGETPEIKSGRVHDEQRLSMLMERLKTDNCLAITASPRIATLNGQQAVMMIGGTVATPDPNGNFIQQSFGTRIEVTPTVGQDGRIHMKVGLELSELIAPGVVGPVTRMDGAMSLQDGQTGFVGGAIRKSRQTEAMPGLGRFPALASWLALTREVEFDEEVLVLLKPTHIPIPPK